MAITTAKGTIIGLGDSASPSTYGAIGQVRSITGPTTKPAIVDITTHDTPGYWRRKLAVLIEAGDVSFEVNFDKSDATHSFTTGLWFLMIGLLKRGYKITFPNSAGVLTFTGYVGQHEFTAPVDNVLSAKMMISITDAISAT